MKNEKILGQQLYTVAFVIISIKTLWDSSSILFQNELLDNLLIIIFLGLMGWKILKQRYTLPVVIAEAVIGLLATYVCVRMHYFYLFFTFIGLAGMQGVDLKRVLKYTSVTKTIMILIHVVPYILTYYITPDQIDYIYRNGVKRQYFYMGHPNTFSMLVGWTLLELTYAYYEKLKVVHLVIFWFINLYVYIYTNSNTSIIVASACLLFFLLERANPEKMVGFLTFGARISYGFFAIFFTAITMLFTKMTGTIREMYELLNKALTGRLLFGSFTYENFGIAWLGNPNVHLYNTTYFEGFWVDSLVYDNTYIYLLVWYGAIFLPLIAYGFFWAERDAEKDVKRNAERILVIGYALFAIMENYANDAVLCFSILFIGQSFYKYYDEQRLEKKEDTRKMEPRVSFIIPAYNIENYIGKCIESIQAQTYQDFEIIIVNDGSTDKTGAVIDEYANKDRRIKVLHKKNEGVSAARNDGIRMAAGEYILFWDGDDFAKPETCEELVNAMDEEKVDAVIYGYYRYKDGEVFETCLPYFDKTRYEGEEILEKVVPQFIGLSYDKVNGWLRGEDKALYVENPALWRIMVCRSVIIKNDLQFDTRLKVGEDTCFISEYLSCSKKVSIKQKCYYYLVTRETSTIFVYEKKVMQKLQGKINLLDGRADLTKRIEARTGKDITDTWAGIVVMSAIQVAFMMAPKNPEYSFGERYKAYKRYVNDPRVKELVKKFPLGLSGGVKKIPFMFLKWNWYGVLFAAVCALNLIHYEFDRG